MRSMCICLVDLDCCTEVDWGIHLDAIGSDVGLLGRLMSRGRHNSNILYDDRWTFWMIG